MLKVYWTAQFKKDYKNAKKSGLDIQKLNIVIDLLMKEEPLPSVYKNHKLSGNFFNHYECHIEPDWLLVYQIIKDKIALILVRTGSHSKILKK